MQIITLIKLGREKDIMDLYENGTIYLNPIDYFRKNEQDSDKGDDYEGVSKIENLPAGELQIFLKGKPLVNRKLRYEKFHIRESYPDVLGNIYSFYSITSKDLDKNNGDFIPDKRLKDLGSHFLLIFDLSKFFDMLKSSFNDSGFKYKMGFVNYYDKENYNGQLTVFHKPDNFSYQNEFRIYLPNESIIPMIITIGSLKEISNIYDSTNVDKLLVKGRKNNNPQHAV
jgi:hypothetical protein